MLATTPMAPVMNVAGSPFWTLWSAGWTMIRGGEVIVPRTLRSPAPPEPPEPDPVPPPFGEVVSGSGDRLRPIVSRAAFVVARPARFVNTTRYSFPFSDGLAVKCSDPMRVWNVGPRQAGVDRALPLRPWSRVTRAAAVKPTRRPAAIVTLRGWTTTAGRRGPARHRTIGAGRGRADPDHRRRPALQLACTACGSMTGSGPARARCGTNAERDDQHRQGGKEDPSLVHTSSSAARPCPAGWWWPLDEHPSATRCSAERVKRASAARARNAAAGRETRDVDSRPAPGPHRESVVIPDPVRADDLDGDAGADREPAAREGWRDVEAGPVGEDSAALPDRVLFSSTEEWWANGQPRPLHLTTTVAPGGTPLTTRLVTLVYDGV